MIPLLLLALASAPSPRAVVVSTDCGAEIDDQWTLAHLAISPEVALKGIVTTHAPGLDAEASAKAARAWFEAIRVPAPPIKAGSSKPLGADGTARDNPGVRFLLDASRGHSADDRLVVAMIGAATDVASALLMDPTWADRVLVVAMAFDGWPEGGDPWNVKDDPAAWRVVLASRVPLVVGDARVTRLHLTQTPASALARFAGRGDPLVSGLDRWIADHPRMAESASGRPGAWPIWDEVVTAYLLGLTSQDDRPRPTLKDDLTLDHSAPQGRVSWITEIDADRLWDDLAKRLPLP